MFAGTRRAAMAAAAFALLGCGDNGGPNVAFPDINAAVLDFFCWSGNRTPPGTVNGTIASTDCDAADVDPADVGYYETWRLRVAASRSVTFTTNAAFDAYLTVVRVNSITGTTVNFTILGEDDDNGPGLNAMLTVALEPGFDYFVAVGGYDYTETGAYSMSMN